MTPIGPVPFVGRQSELAELKQHLAVVSLVSLHGALGSGKTRLVSELAPDRSARRARVIECHPGDRASALRARAERALRCVPGTLAQTLAQQARVLVIDDIQHLRTDEATSLLSPLLLGPTALGRIVVVGRDPLAAAVGARSPSSSSHGLDVEAAQRAVGEPRGDVRRGRRLRRRVRPHPRRSARRCAASSRALGSAQTRGTSPTLDAPARVALEALAILRQPVAPAAVSALAPGVDIEAALTEPRRAPARRCASVTVASSCTRSCASTCSRRWRPRHAPAVGAPPPSSSRAPLRVSKGPRLAWQAGDDGAFGAMDQITRVREVVWHWLAAGDRDRAADVAARRIASSPRARGGAGEFEALLDALGDRPRRRAGSDSETVAADDRRAPLDPERARALAALRIEIAVRGGRYTEAFERASAAPGAVSPLLHAELTLASGDVAGARRALQGLHRLAGSERARARDRDARRARAARRQARRRRRAPRLARRRRRTPIRSRARAFTSRPRASTSTRAASPRCARRSRALTARARASRPASKRASCRRSSTRAARSASRAKAASSKPRPRSMPPMPPPAISMRSPSPTKCSPPARSSRAAAVTATGRRAAPRCRARPPRAR